MNLKAVNTLTDSVLVNMPSVTTRRVQPITASRHKAIQKTAEGTTEPYPSGK